MSSSEPQLRPPHAARAAAALSRAWLTAVLAALMGFAAISTDLYLPAMPTMARALNADQTVMQWTISSYLIGLSLGQLFWGPIGDRFGRRAPIALGLVLFMASSIGCALSTNGWHVLFWRAAQSLGACAGVVLSRAMVRDLYGGDRAAQMLSSLMTVMAVAPLIAPLIGAQILVHASWRAVFWTLAAFGAASFAAIYTLPETLPPERRNREPLTRAMGGYLTLLRERSVLGYAGACAFLYGGMFAYIAGAPFAYIDHFGVSPAQFGLLFGAGGLAIMATNFINARLVMRWGGVRLLRIGAGVAAIAGLIAIINSMTGFGGLVGLFAPLLAFVGMNGLIVANAVSGAMERFPERAGAASALLGALQYGAGVVGAGFVGAFADGTPRPMTWAVALAGLGVAACAATIAPRARKPGF